MAFFKLMVVQLATLAVMVGMVSWLLASFFGVAASVECIVENVNNLLALKGTVGANINKLIGDGAIRSTLTQTDQLIGIFRAIVIIPIAVITPCELLLLFCGVCAKMCGSARRSKCLIVIINFFCILGVVFYASLAGSSTFPLDKQAVMKQAGCVGESGTSIDGFKTTFQGYVDTYTKLSDRSGLSSSTAESAIADAELNLAEAKKAVTYVGNLCTCLESFLDNWGTLGTPGFVAAAVVLVLFIENLYMCWLLGCCCGVPKDKPKAKPTAEV